MNLFNRERYDDFRQAYYNYCVEKYYKDANGFLNAVKEIKKMPEFDADIVSLGDVVMRLTMVLDKKGTFNDIKEIIKKTIEIEINEADLYWLFEYIDAHFVNYNISKLTDLNVKRNLKLASDIDFEMLTCITYIYKSNQ